MGFKRTFMLLTIAILILAGVIIYSNALETWNVLKRTDLRWFSAGILSWAAAFALRAYRWKALMKDVDIRIPFVSLLKIYAVGKMISNITPSRAGDPIKALILKKRFGESFSIALSSIVMEKLGDGLALFLILIVGGMLPSVPISEEWTWASAVLFVLLISTFLKLKFSKKKSYKISTLFAKMISMSAKMKRKRGKIAIKTNKFVNAFKKYRKRTVFWTGLISVPIWILDGMALWISFKAIGIAIPVGLTIFAVPIINFVGIASFLPGSIGAAEFTSITFFVGFAGLAAPEAAAATILWRVVGWWTYSLLGIAVLLTTYKLKEIVKWTKGG